MSRTRVFIDDWEVTELGAVCVDFKLPPQPPPLPVDVAKEFTFPISLEASFIDWDSSGGRLSAQLTAGLLDIVTLSIQYRERQAIVLKVVSREPDYSRPGFFTYECIETDESLEARSVAPCR
jgi:hypothetical protein